MCIIAIKPSNKGLWTDETIKEMFVHNNDGAGYMYPVDGKVIIRKGFMTLSSLLKSMKSVDGIESLPVILHCRIGTHGDKKSVQNCHPFPVGMGNKIQPLQAKRITTELGMVHNGIISTVTPRSTISDTMEYVLKVVNPIYEKYTDFYTDNRYLAILEKVAGSKLAFLSGDGTFSYVGSFVEDDGYIYSNDSYKPRKVAPYFYPKKWDYRKGHHLSPVPSGAYETITNEDGTIIYEDVPSGLYIDGVGNYYIIWEGSSYFYGNKADMDVRDIHGDPVVYTWEKGQWYEKETYTQSGGNEA